MRIKRKKYVRMQKYIDKLIEENQRSKKQVHVLVFEPESTEAKMIKFRENLMRDMQSLLYRFTE